VTANRQTDGRTDETRSAAYTVVANDVTKFTVATYGVTTKCIRIILVRCQAIAQPTLISALQLQER